MMALATGASELLNRRNFWHDFRHGFGKNFSFRREKKLLSHSEKPNIE